MSKYRNSDAAFCCIKSNKNFFNKNANSLLDCHKKIRRAEEKESDNNL